MMLRAFSYTQISPLKSLRPLHSLLHSPISFSSLSSSSLSSMASPISTVDHIVLFKVRDSTDPSKIETMISNLRLLSSLNIATHLTAGPIFRSLSGDLSFTHLLYSRYRSKADLAAYSDHPSHLSVVNDNVFPICDDVMAIDWVAEGDVGAFPLPGELVRVAVGKPREGIEGLEVVGAIDGVRVRVSLPDSVKVSYGVNFSPGRAKGYELGFVSVFAGAEEADAVEGDEEVVKIKEKIGTLLESVIVVDYLVASPASSKV